MVNYQPGLVQGTWQPQLATHSALLHAQRGLAHSQAVSTETALEVLSLIEGYRNGQFCEDDVTRFIVRHSQLLMSHRMNLDSHDKILEELRVATFLRQQIQMLANAESKFVRTEDLLSATDNQPLPPQAPPEAVTEAETPSQESQPVTPPVFDVRAMPTFDSSLFC